MNEEYTKITWSSESIEVQEYNAGGVAGLVAVYLAQRMPIERIQIIR
ncbi:MAG: hypothetical protein M3Y53_03575 [Thermoproteota archaeon]|nr:hypothetical protein [Thermoproteota archaeon]